MRLHEVLKDEVHHRRRRIEDVGDPLELFHDRASHDGGEEVHLRVEFVPHSWALASVISSGTKQLRTYSTMPGEENDSELSTICEIFQGVGVSGRTLATNFGRFDPKCCVVLTNCMNKSGVHLSSLP